MLHIDFWQAMLVVYFKTGYVLCLKVNKRQQKCNVNCTSKSHELSWKGKYLSIRKIYNDRSFWLQGQLGRVVSQVDKMCLLGHQCEGGGGNTWVKNQLCIRVLWKKMKKQDSEYLYYNVVSFIAVQLSFSLSHTTFTTFHDKRSLYFYKQVFLLRFPWYTTWIQNNRRYAILFITARTT